MLEQEPVIKILSLKQMVEDVLKEHHEPTRQWIERAKVLLREAAAENIDSPLINKLGMSFQSLAMTMHMHMEKEEEVLFPMFQRIEDGLNTEKICGGIENPIRVMENEHKDLDLHFERIRRITNNFQKTPETTPVVNELYEVLKSLESDLKIHSEKEERELFPAAVVREKRIVEHRVE